MNTPGSPQAQTPSQGPEDRVSALFAHLVIQQTNLALMFLGKMPHPESGETMQEIESAQMFIDQLEMLQIKTQGNLNKHEDALLKQSLMSLRLAFVEAVEKPTPGPKPSPRPEEPTAPRQTSAAASSQPEAASTASPPAPEGEPHKKFTKRY